MAKKKVVTSNIQDNHTLAEYQRYFSHLLAKGKLKRYPLKEKNKLDTERQYWLIKDEKGDSYYYELPRYVRPSSSQSAYSMSRVMHRRPARIAIAIFAGVAVLSFTSMIIGKNLKHDNPIIPPEPVNPEGIFALMQNFEKWQIEHPGEDASKAFSISDLATLSMANALYDKDQYDEESGTYPRRKLLTVGEGYSDTAPFGVHVTIHNAFVCNGADALEESISYSTHLFGPKSGRRDFYTASDEHVNSNSGNVTDSTKGTIEWHNYYDKDHQYESIKDYMAAAGKIPDNPFLYIIDETTVLDDSTVTKTDSGYTIVLNLDPEPSTLRYQLRMKYLSGHTVDHFENVKLTFTTDNNLFLLANEVEEVYYVKDDIIGILDPFLTNGGFKTKYYYDNIPDIPDIATPFDYSPYLPIR